MNVMGIIFANDATTGVLTEKRTMASLPFGGKNDTHYVHSGDPPILLLSKP